MIAAGDSYLDQTRGDLIPNLIAPFDLYLPGPVHFGDYNLLFCDGHVERDLPQELTPVGDPSDLNNAPVLYRWNRDHQR